MKRSRRRGPAAPQPEVCGVWLDTAELKRSPAQSLLAKPKVSSGVPGRKLSSGALTWGRAFQPPTKQTTITAFFPTQTDEKDKENSRPSPFTPSKDSKGKGTCLAAAPVKILALPRMEEARKGSFRAGEELVQVTPWHGARAAPASPNPVPDSWALQMGSQGKRGVGENSCFPSFTRDCEGNRITGHRFDSDLLAGEAAPASGSVTPACGRSQPAEAAGAGLCFQPRLRKPHRPSSVNALTDLSESEGTDPAVPRDGARAAGPPSAGGAARAWPLRERSRNAGASSAGEGPGGPCRQLFTQDSEGTRVIAHRDVPPPSSPGGGGPWSQLGEQRSGARCDLLFTQDSEGNRVIKHW